MSFGNNSLIGGGSLGGGTGQQSSLFGSTNNATNPLGGASTTNQPAPNTSSLFNQTQSQPLGQSTGLGQTQTNNGQSKVQQAQATQPAFFNSLLERSKKRSLSNAGQDSMFGDMPSLQLGLDDIRKKARELGTSGNKDSQQNGATPKA